VNPDLTSIEDAAAEFGIHRTTLFRWIAEGRLKSHRSIGDRRTYVHRAELQQLVDTPTVTRCLEIVYQEFRTTAEWPRAIELQRRLDQQREDFDLLSALENLPQELGFRVRDQEGRAQLRLLGIARCERSTDDVAAFLGLVRACYERYIESDGHLEVTSSELAEEFGYDRLLLEKLYKIVQIEHGFWSGLGYGEDGWQLQVEPERIRFFNNVNSLSDYLAAKQRAFQPAAGPASPSLAVDTPVPTVDAELHAAIANAIGGLMEEPGTPAVMAAATAFERLLAEHLGAEGGRSGRALVSAYFDRVQRVAPDASRIEALRSLVLGSLGAFRNPAAHGRLTFDGPYAREIVQLYSLLAREVDALSPVRARTNNA
jgi:excisionase family DNA binding protein